MAEARPLPPHVRAEVERILNAEARRILDEQLAERAPDPFTRSGALTRC